MVALSQKNWIVGFIVFFRTFAIGELLPYEVVNNISAHLDVQIEVVNNFPGDIPCSRLGADWGACANISFHLTYAKNASAIPANIEWKIYFSSIRPILHNFNNFFTIEHLTGDLHVLYPTEKFPGFQADHRYTIPIVIMYWSLHRTDWPPRWYVTYNGLSRTIMNTDTDDVRQFVMPIGFCNYKLESEVKHPHATPENRYTSNKNIINISNFPHPDRTILPTPMQTYLNDGECDLSNIQLDLPELSIQTNLYIKKRFQNLGVNIVTRGGYKINASLEFTGSENGMYDVPEGYYLNMMSTYATIQAHDLAGIFYGVISLLSHLPATQKKVVCLTVLDKPRFPYRGFMVDVGRNFHPPDTIYQVLDEMAALKLNKFHFHLTDDEGWRLEIPTIPELSSIGGKRCHDISELNCILPQLGSGPDNTTSGSGYYKKADYINIIKAAKARFIEVIPEFDMPAHIRAAVVSLESSNKKGKITGSQYRLYDPEDASQITSVQFYNRKGALNPCLKSSKDFLATVVSDVKAMHNEAGQPITTWHFGGDELKNVKLGNGHQDRCEGINKVSWRGDVNRSAEDLPWAKSPQCASMPPPTELANYWVDQIGEILKEKNITKIQSWQDGSKANVTNKPQKFTVNVWETLFWGAPHVIEEKQKNGYDIILSMPDFLYFDHPYEYGPEESGFYWAYHFVDVRKTFSLIPENIVASVELYPKDKNGALLDLTAGKTAPLISGIQGQVWSEIVRTREQLEYMVFPRMHALAERAWHKANWEPSFVPGTRYNSATHYVNKTAYWMDYSYFAHLLGHKILSQNTAAYRIPPPGAQLIDDKLYANVELPGLPIQYSVNNGIDWLNYSTTPTIITSPTVLLRTLSCDFSRKSRYVKVPHQPIVCKASSNIDPHNRRHIPDPLTWPETSVPVDCPVDNAAAVFLSDIDTEWEKRINKAVESSWRLASNITDHNQGLNIQSGLEYVNYTNNKLKKILSWPSHLVKDPNLKRQFAFQSLKGISVLNNEETQRLLTVGTEMESLYSKGKICAYDEPANSCTASLRLGSINSKYIFTSRNYDELLYAWKEWRDDTGPKIRPYYLEYLQFQKQVANLSGYADASEMWTWEYEFEAYENGESFFQDVKTLFEELKPLYEQLHAYVRGKLRQVYGADKVDEKGPIPAHLLGNMWAQNWQNIFDIIQPYNGTDPLDVTPTMVSQGYNATRMFRDSEDFFTSLGFPAMTNTFWEKSIIERPSDGRELTCHASAWDFFKDDDFRIKMCTEITMRDYGIVHHEMGHIAYDQQYKIQPVVFRDGANPGFHEAVGDSLALSVLTPKHLQKLGLLQNLNYDHKQEINYLMYVALGKVAFLPFGYLVDNYRWELFREDIKPEDLNCGWWKLRQKIQGVVPPVVRTEQDFDPGAKYHIPGNVPYIRYFVSYILQFQFHKAMCKVAGEYQENDPERPLHRCDIFESKEAGRKFSDMLKLGKSVPWPDALEKLTGTRKISALPLREYFAPLEKWLQEENQKNGNFVGWHNDGNLCGACIIPNQNAVGVNSSSCPISLFNGQSCYQTCLVGYLPNRKLMEGQEYTCKDGNIIGTILECIPDTTSSTIVAPTSAPTQISSSYLIRISWIVALILLSCILVN